MLSLQHLNRQPAGGPPTREGGWEGAWPGGGMERPEGSDATVYTVLSCKHVPPLLQLPGPSLLSCPGQLCSPPATTVPEPLSPHQVLRVEALPCPWAPLAADVHHHCILHAFRSRPVACSEHYPVSQLPDV